VVKKYSAVAKAWTWMPAGFTLNINGGNDAKNLLYGFFDFDDGRAALCGSIND
jgi:hypothetical protein